MITHKMTVLVVMSLLSMMFSVSVAQGKSEQQQEPKPRETVVMETSM